MKRATLAALLLLAAACAAPPGRSVIPEGDPFAGLAPPPLPAPGTFSYPGPLGPAELGSPPVTIVPASEQPLPPVDGEFPVLGEANAYGSDAPYGDDFGARRFRRPR